MNDEEMLALEELERDIETLQEFLKEEEEPKAAELDEPKEPEVAEEAPKPKPKAKSKPKAKKAEEKVVEDAPAPTPATAQIQTKTEAPTRLYGAARLRAKRGR